MDYLQEGIGLRSFGQRDPLIEYQREGFTMFSTLLDAIKEESVGFLYNVDVQVNEPEPETAPSSDVSTWLQDEPAPAPGRTPAMPAAPVAGPPVGAAAHQHEHEHPEVLAKGLGPQRPQRLEYTSPTVDGEAGVSRSAPPDATGPVGPGIETGPIVHPGQVVGTDTPRNAPCPCGSGKKYKRCHGDPRNREGAAG
jgi:preprotein translocase subunit SecA